MKLYQLNYANWGTAQDFSTNEIWDLQLCVNTPFLTLDSAKRQAELEYGDHFEGETVPPIVWGGSDEHPHSTWTLAPPVADGIVPFVWIITEIEPIP